MRGGKHRTPATGLGSSVTRYGHHFLEFLVRGRLLTGSTLAAAHRPGAELRTTPGLPLPVENGSGSHPGPRLSFVYQKGAGSTGRRNTSIVEVPDGNDA